MRTTSWREIPRRPPQGPLIDGRRHGVEGCGLQLGDVGGYGYPPEVRLLDRLVRVLQEQGNPSSPAHRAAHRGAAHDVAKGYLVRLRQVPVPGDIDVDVRLGQAEVGAAGFTRLHLPEVARLDIVATGRRGRRCGVVLCGVVWCCVVWCGVVLCCVVWCGVPKALLPKGKGRDVYPRVQVNGLGCVCCVRAVCKCVVA